MRKGIQRIRCGQRFLEVAETITIGIGIPGKILRVEIISQMSLIWLLFESSACECDAARRPITAIKIRRAHAEPN